MIRFCLLGTAAGGAPTLRRAPAALVAQIEATVFLFDCGEGTQRQLIRAGIPRGRIALIALTHLHGDHLFGLAPLLSSMVSDRRRRPLQLIGPRGIGDLLHQTLRSVDVQLSFELEIRELEPGYQGELLVREQWQLSCAPLQHSVPCFGFRLQRRRLPALDRERLAALGLRPGRLLGELKRRGWIQLPSGERLLLEQVSVPRAQPTLVYCGDTRPCWEAVELADRADVLIHEATFTNAHAELARQSFHSTAAEAATVASLARVRRLLLTHFSTRYDSAEELLAEARACFPATELGRELQWETLSGSDSLQDERQPLANPDAECGQPIAGTIPMQGAGERADQARAAHP